MGVMIYKVDQESNAPTWFICGNVGDGFATNCLKLYTGNGVIMHISDILYIFVEMWQCGIIKKYLKNMKYIC